MSRFANSGPGQAWAKLPSEVRTLVLAGLGVVLLACVLLFMLIPSLKVLRYATADHQALDVKLDTVRALAAQAQAIQNEPKPSHDEAIRFVENSAKQRLLGTAQVTVSGDRATLTLNNTKPEALSAWLTDARTNGRLLPIEAKLTRSDAGWSGQLVLNLPAPK